MDRRIVTAVGQGIPLNMVQRWLGHAQLTTTAFYAEAVGEKERAIGCGRGELLAGRDYAAADGSSLLTCRSVAICAGSTRSTG